MQITGLSDLSLAADLGRRGGFSFRKVSYLMIS